MTGHLRVPWRWPATAPTPAMGSGAQRRANAALITAMAVLSTLVLSATPADAGGGKGGWHHKHHGGSVFPDNGWVNPIEDGRYRRSDFGRCVDRSAHLGVDSRKYPGAAVRAMAAGTVVDIVEWKRHTSAVVVEHTTSDGAKVLGVYGNVVPRERLERALADGPVAIASAAEFADLGRRWRRATLHLGIRPLAEGETYDTLEDFEIAEYVRCHAVRHTHWRHRHAPKDRWSTFWDGAWSKHHKDYDWDRDGHDTGDRWDHSRREWDRTWERKQRAWERKQRAWDRKWRAWDRKWDRKQREWDRKWSKWGHKKRRGGWKWTPKHTYGYVDPLPWLKKHPPADDGDDPVVCTPDEFDVDETITGSVDDPDTMPGWRIDIEERHQLSDALWGFREDPEDARNLNCGSLRFGPLPAEASRTFIAAFIPDGGIAPGQLESVSWDYYVGEGANHDQFRLSVYTTQPYTYDDPGVVHPGWYDCRYDYRPPSSTETGWFEFDTSNLPTPQHYINDDDDDEFYTGDCALGDTATGIPSANPVVQIALHGGDQFELDEGMTGAFDDVVITVEGESTRFDFEPAQEDESDEDGSEG